jgi:serine/threonine protein kinase
MVGTLLADRYKIEALLGQGGMGTVYRAEHIHMRRTVALKVLHREIAVVEEFAARFEREAVAAGRIEHRNVAKAMDFGRLSDGSFYLVIEYVKGTSLRELIKQGPLAPVTALEIARQIADALNAAHQAGVVHRDLKPDNVMIAERDAEGCWVKVLDFGVAKLATDEASGDSPITRYGAIIGTPEYMAPEQAGGTVVDHRADLYALGVILYELLSGQPPFSGDDRVVVLSKHFVEPPPALPASIPEKTAAIVFDLLAKEPASRIQTAAGLVERIAEASAEMGPAAAASPLEPPTIDDTMLDEGAPSAPPQRRQLPKARALVVFAAIAMIGGAILVATAERDKNAESSAGSGTTTPQAATQPAASSIAPPRTTPAKSESAETTRAAQATGAAQATEAMQANAAAETSAAPEASPAPGSSSVQVRTTAAPRKTIVAPRPGQKIVIRRRVIRRTVITTSR